MEEDKDPLVEPLNQSTGVPIEEPLPQDEEVEVASLFQNIPSAQPLKQFLGDNGLVTVKDIVAAVNDDACFKLLVHDDRRSGGVLMVATWSKLRTACRLEAARLQYQEQRFSCVDSIPLLNTIWGFFNRTPTEDELKLLLNLLLLNGTLMLSIAISSANSTKYSDLTSAINRFSSNSTANQYYNDWCIANFGGYGWHGPGGTWPDDECGWSMYSYYSQLMAYSVACFEVTVAGIVMIYVFFAFSGFGGHNDKEMRAKLFSAWWMPVKFCVAIFMTTTIMGVIFVMLAVRMIYTFNSPDYYLDANGKHVRDNSEYSTNPGHSFAYYETVQWVSISVWFCCVLIGSAGTCLKSIKSTELQTSIRGTKKKQAFPLQCGK